MDTHRPTHCSQNQSRFLTLPAELRLEIYKHLIPARVHALLYYGYERIGGEPGMFFHGRACAGACQMQELDAQCGDHATRVELGYEDYVSSDMEGETKPQVHVERHLESVEGPKRVELQVLRVCRIMYREFCDALYGKTTFVMHDLVALSLFLDSEVEPESSRLIRSLELLLFPFPREIVTSPRNRGGHHGPGSTLTPRSQAHRWTEACQALAKLPNLRSLVVRFGSSVFLYAGAKRNAVQYTEEDEVGYTNGFLDFLAELKDVKVRGRGDDAAQGEGKILLLLPTVRRSLGEEDEECVPQRYDFEEMERGLEERGVRARVQEWDNAGSTSQGSMGHR